MLSEELRKRVTDGALRYFTSEQLAERSKFDEELDFLQSSEQPPAENLPGRLRIMIDGVGDRKITITIG